MLKTIKMVLVVSFVSMLFAFGANQTKAQTIQPNDGTFEYIKVLSDGLAIKLTSLGLNYGWTKDGAADISRRVIWLAGKANNVCYNIKIEKLARQIQLHAIAFRAPIKSVKEHANPVNVTWREIF